jgi:hypothetical protein
MGAADHILGRTDSSCRLHMIDFNPSAVARSIDKVICESTILESVGLVYKAYACSAGFAVCVH